MAMLSISGAAKVFDVSRPTLQKHLKNGVISGKKDTANNWQIDTAELARVYATRLAPGEKRLPPVLPPVVNDLQADLKAEIEVLRRDLAVAEALADDRGTRLDQAMKLLEGPKARRWWQFGS